MSPVENPVGAGAVVMAACCALLPLLGAAIGGDLIASAGTIGLTAGVVVLGAFVAVVTRRRQAGSRCRPR